MRILQDFCYFSSKEKEYHTVPKINTITFLNIILAISGLKMQTFEELAISVEEMISGL